MKISSKNLNKRKKLLSNKVDTVYMNTDSLFCYNVEKNIETGKNIKKIEISKKMIEKESNYVEIYDTSATNLYFEKESNFGDISLPIDYICEENIFIELHNENIGFNFKKINIIKDNQIVFEINLDSSINLLEIRQDKYDYDLYININSKKGIRDYSINKDGTYYEKLYNYCITEEDFDINNNLDIRKFNNYETFSCEKKDINTLIVDKNIFKNINKYYSLGLFEKIDHMPNIEKIRFIDNDNMRLIPFDETFHINEVLLGKGDTKYLFIKTKDDEIVIFVDKYDKLVFISKKDLLKDTTIKNIYFRFRNLMNNNGGVLRPISLIIKEYKNGDIVVNDLFKNYTIDDKFKNNIINNIDELKLLPDDKNYIINNNWIGLFNDNSFNNSIYKKLVLKHLEEERNMSILRVLGFNDSAIEYLKLRGIIKNIINSTISDVEVKGFNEIGENYKKVLKKSR